MSVAFISVVFYEVVFYLCNVLRVQLYSSMTQNLRWMFDITNKIIDIMNKMFEITNKMLDITINITNILNSEETTLLFAPIVCNRGHFPQIKKLNVTLWRQIKIKDRNKVLGFILNHYFFIWKKYCKANFNIFWGFKAKILKYKHIST